MIDPNPLGCFGSREDFDTVDAPVPVFGDFGAQSHGLRFGAGDFEVAALDDVGVDPFAARHVDHFVDGVVEHLLPGDHTVAAVALGQ